MAAAWSENQQRKALLDDTALATTGEIRTVMMERRSDCIFESYS